MTDTGQVPGEGLPENAGMVEQPGVPAHGAYTYLSETTAEDEDLLLLPGAQSPWGNEVAPPAPEPVVETVHEPGPHETAGRDSGSVDLGGVRLPDPAPTRSAPSVPIPPITPRRPLHLGPPTPDASASPVRSLADRGPAGAPVRHPGPPTVGPEYLDAPPQGAVPWGAPPQPSAAPGAPAAETVVPSPSRPTEPLGAAQAVMARITTEATAVQGQETAYDALGESAQAMAGPETAATGHSGELGRPVPGAGNAHGAAIQQGEPLSQATQGAAADHDAESGQNEPSQQAGELAHGAQPEQGGVPGHGIQSEQGDLVGHGAQPEQGSVLGHGAEPGQGGVPGHGVQSEQGGVLGHGEGPGHGGVSGQGVQSGQGDLVGHGAQLEQGSVLDQAEEPGQGGVLEHAAPGNEGEPGHGAEAGQVAGPGHGAESGQVADPGHGAESAHGAVPGDAAQSALSAAPAHGVHSGQDGEVVFGGSAVASVDADGAAPGAESGQLAAASGSADGGPVTAGVVEAGLPVAGDAVAAGGDGAGTVPASEVVAEHAGTTAAVPEAEAAPLAEGDQHGGPADQTAPAAQTVAATGVEVGDDAGQLPEAVPVPVTESAENAQFPAPESEQVGGVGGPEAGDVSDAVEAIQAPEVMAPDAGQAADSADLAPAQPTDTAVPVPVTEPSEDAQFPAPESEQVGGVGGPEAGDVSDAVEAIQAPEVMAPDAGQAADSADLAPAQPTDTAVPAQGPDTAVTPEAPDNTPFPAAPHTSHPADGSPAPVEDADRQSAPSGEPTTPVAPQLVEAVSPVQDPAAPLQGPVLNTPEHHAPTSADPANAPQPVAVTNAPDTAASAAEEQPGPTAGPQAGQSLGQFVPVEGSVPTTPHLAPTPPHALTLPPEDAPEAVAPVPAPREADPELVQHADDLDTRAADQEESTAPVEEVRQSTGPAAPAYDDAEREAVLKVMRERRDIRNGFRADPIPHEVLLRVLEAAHTAPSVGHSQPWDFVVIRSADTRRSMHELAMRQRDAYAKSLPKGRAKQFKELKIEAILDTPVNIVVTADPTRGGRHTLGRHTQPQMAPYSAALAVENLWLAARAEGLGVGWVSFFDEREMVRALGLPEHLEVIAYLCVGYVDEFPDEPELMQAGWSKRRPLSWVVHEETYGRRALPGEEPHDLLSETVAQIRPLDAKALGEAWERQKRMTKPAGALGMLEIISAQLSGLSRQCPPPIPEPAAVAIFAGDHGVHAQGVTPWPQEVTAQMVANFLGGGAVCNAFAGQVGAEVCVVDVGVAADLPATPGLLPRKVRAGTSDMTTGPAMTREEAKQAIEVGIETARDLVAAGNKALLTGEMGIANTTASAALISVFTDTDPAEVTGRGTGINDETLARKTEVVRRAIEFHQPDPADPIGVLAAIGGFEHAAMVGLLLGGASLRTPVILDGVSAGAAALVARAIAPEVLAACIAGHRSAEPGHVAALNKLGLRPLVDLDLRLGEGTGALLALPLVQSTARAMHEVATFDSAGVTEK
ncbi:nicotinate-nucleotide--dimethylbenzimidazole phosphoribosyltransferase [Streptomyces gilvus]|uniref:nicotinate-nucleotide--dimethylbenzimidazole phosphoribosyltransferase n=1 Tax=Streptomyces gilvus TaxID=2920937 RepID=UPI001F10F9C6|nr:nicotinate-nucleotide--dimethylbenzimidazole phosphoribosyltransferase [Streptomyces sp. CME 23]MCH5673450.1 nicotinate-nucleotide--dimethylbenzimidazole phosphoribosyltransferase [Streptomyces sp. CME 23]